MTGRTDPAGPADAPGTTRPADAEAGTGPAAPAGAASPAGPAGSAGSACAAGPAGVAGPAGAAGPAGTTDPAGAAGRAGGGDPALARLSLNQRTVAQWDVAQVVDGCVRFGIPAVGLWREPVAEYGIDRTVRLVRDAGLRVSSLCRGGFLTDPAEPARSLALEDNRRAIEEAATLGAACLVLVVGGLPAGSRDLPGARETVRRALHELVPYARDHGVRLALEPMHPMYCADRGVVATLAQALDIAADFPSADLGVVVDTFHLWWDPEVWRQIERAGDRIASYQVSDWVVPLAADVLLARGYMGDGCIDFRSFTRAVDAAGYRGDIEVEIFNADVWSSRGDDVLTTMTQRYKEHVC